MFWPSYLLTLSNHTRNGILLVSLIHCSFRSRISTSTIDGRGGMFNGGNGCGRNEGFELQTSQWQAGSGPGSSL